MPPVDSDSPLLVTFMIVIVIVMVLGNAQQRGPSIFADILNWIQTNGKSEQIWICLYVFFLKIMVCKNKDSTIEYED